MKFFGFNNLVKCIFTVLTYSTSFYFTEAHSFTNCGLTSGLGIDSIILNPDPPEIGNNLAILFSGTSNQTILNGSYLNIELSVLGIKIANHNYDLCNELNLRCPLYPGDTFNSSFSYKIPNNVPKGISIEAVLSAYDNKHNDISCLKLETKLESGFTSNNNIFKQSELLFHYWREQYNWKFKSLLEFINRLYIFHHNNLLIRYYNNLSNNTFTLAHNQFSHLTNNEYRKLMLPNKIKPTKNIPSLTRMCFNHDYHDNNLNNSVDWRNLGAVTNIKNQGQCGSCWAFSTIGALEGAYYLKTGNLTSFSEQQLVSCDKVDQGCNGGEMDNAFEWIHNNSGICSEADYPYQSGTGVNFSCHKCTRVKNSNIVSIVDVNQTEDALMQAISKQPVAIAIEADSIMFQFYKEGVFNSHCGTNLDHGVLLIGYGIENNNKYWLVKNSWGEQWGDSGYIKMARGLSQKGGQCGILLSASYPLL